jgi:beta-hydroxylase
MLMFSKVPRTPYLPTSTFPELAPLQANWREIREEAVNLQKNMQIKAAANNDDARLQLLLQDRLEALLPQVVRRRPPFGHGAVPQDHGPGEVDSQRQGRHVCRAAARRQAQSAPRPLAGSLRYHLAVLAPNDDRCMIEVDGQPIAGAKARRDLRRDLYALGREPQRRQPHRAVLRCGTPP